METQNNISVRSSEVASQSSVLLWLSTFKQDVILCALSYILVSSTELLHMCTITQRWGHWCFLISVLVHSKYTLWHLLNAIIDYIKKKDREHENRCFSSFHFRPPGAVFFGVPSACFLAKFQLHYKECHFEMYISKCGRCGHKLCCSKSNNLLIWIIKLFQLLCLCIQDRTGALFLLLDPYRAIRLTWSMAKFLVNGSSLAGMYRTLASIKHYVVNEVSHILWK